MGWNFGVFLIVKTFFMKSLKSIGIPLSRYEQKSIMGGADIYCSATIYDSDGGSYYNFGGACGSSNMNECNQYAEAACKAAAYGAGDGYSCGQTTCSSGY